jgi:precorrin-2 dehydrogenase/sirohydrochlorin ferrochelatase
MPATYPILLDLRDRLVVIIGGGHVAARKAHGLIAGSGSSGDSVRVRVVAPEISDATPSGIERVNERYRAEHLNGATLVFAATDSPDVNEAVVRDARARNILVSRADEPDDGDFALPAIHRDGPITVTVSANSPALSAFIRDELALKWDRRLRALADEMQSLRPLITASKLAATRRAEVLRSLASREAMDVLNSSGSNSLRDWLVARFPDLQPILDARSR